VSRSGSRLQTGIRVLDGMVDSWGAGPARGHLRWIQGVGKSTLIGMMTRNTAADLTVCRAGG